MPLVNQVVILAAGECSRFFPFTRSSHKSDFIIAGKPIIARTLEALARIGIAKIEVVESPNSGQSLKSTFARYVPQGIQVNFHLQPEALGTGNAVIQALPALENRFLVINPQQINVDEHLESLGKHPEFLSSPDNLILFSKATTNPNRYGMFTLDGFKVTGLVEKPIDLTGLSNQRNVGVYLLTRDFVEFMNTFPPSEFQLTDVALNQYVKSHPAFAVEIEETGLTLKYAWDLFGINKFIQNDGRYISPTAYIGPGCQIGKNVNIEDGCRLDHDVILENCLVGRNTTIKSGQISDSIIGDNVTIGENFITQTHNDTSTPVETVIKNKLVSTGLISFGVLVGDNSTIGDNVTSLPGAVVAPNSSVNSHSSISPPVVENQ